MAIMLPDGTSRSCPAYTALSGLNATSRQVHGNHYKTKCTSRCCCLVDTVLSLPSK